MTHQGIYVIENFFFDDECEYACELIEKFHAGESSIKTAPEIIEHFKTRIIARMPTYLTRVDGTKVKVYGLTNDVTLGQGNMNIAFHKDESKHKDNTFKLTVYVNDLSSDEGTEFKFNEYESFKVNHKKGNAILFDISILHGGITFPRTEIKKSIGFRILTEKIN